jgi:hypothetical protein
MEQTTEELVERKRESEEKLAKLKKEREEREQRLSGRDAIDASDGDAAEAAAAAAVAGAEEKEGEGYYLIPKKACGECGKRVPLKVTKAKYKNHFFRNKAKLVCANEKCSGMRLVFRGGLDGRGVRAGVDQTTIRTRRRCRSTRRL